jgi:hypothetical protein
MAGMVQVALADVADAVVVVVAAALAEEDDNDNANPNLNLETCNRFLQKTLSEYMNERNLNLK